MIIVKFKPIFIDILERADFSLSAIIASLELTVGSSMNPLGIKILLGKPSKKNTGKLVTSAKKKGGGSGQNQDLRFL